jgi:hypothetical protein
LYPRVSASTSDSSSFKLSAGDVMPCRADSYEQ